MCVQRCFALVQPQENKDSLSHQEPWLSQGGNFAGLLYKEERNKAASSHSLCASRPQHPEGLHAPIQKGKSFLKSWPPFPGGAPAEIVSSAEMSDRILAFGSRPAANQAEAVGEITPSSCPAPLRRGGAALWLSKFSETETR